MVFALPAVNAEVATGQPGTGVCVTGDGSLMTTLYEVVTIKEYKLDVKLSVINNDAYASMHNTQPHFCNGHYVGAYASGGVYIPPIVTWRNPLACLASDAMLKMIWMRKILEMLAEGRSVLCEVIAAMCDQKIIPAVISDNLGDGRMPPRRHIICTPTYLKSS